ncbi:MSF1-domain-containing protein [Lactarius indigo]|nr:MSF1-domain-containing protein [Lactarius indigo]
MHYFSQSFNYDHSWAHVIIGMWHKYPNPHCSHVVTVDVIDRSINPITGLIRTERVLGCKQRAPTWIVKLFGGSEDAFVREISFVDPSTQTTTISSILYSPAPGGRTAFHQTAEIQARMVMWRTAADKLENWLAMRFEQNAQLGKVGFTDVLRQLWEEAKEKSPVGTPA